MNMIAACDVERLVRQCWDDILSAGLKVSKVSLSVGWDVAFIRHQDRRGFAAWNKLGFADEKAARVASKVSRSTWYQCARIAEFFPEMVKEEFLTMSIENAEVLASQPEEVRYDAATVAKAATMTCDDLKDYLAVAKAQREGRSPRSARTAIEWEVSRQQRQVILTKLRQWKDEHHITDDAQALELLVVEVTDHATLVGFIQESIIRLTRAVMAAKTAEDFEQLRELFAGHIREMGEILEICARPKEEMAA